MTMARLGERVARLEERVGVGEKVLLAVVAEDRADFDRQMAEARAKYGPSASFSLCLIWLGGGPMPTRKEVQ